MRPIDKNKLKEKFHSSEELMERYVGPKESSERIAFTERYSGIAVRT